MKAESLVKALYNHFKSNNLDTSSHDDADMLDQKTVKDMDKDLSASVTVSQVNEFTAARPNIWRRVSALISSANVGSHMITDVK